MLHHVKTMHSGRKFACAQCQRSYVTKGGLTEHVNKLHKKLSRYRCQTCGKGFIDRCLYHDHIAAHSGVKRHACSICDMKFTYKSSLKEYSSLQDNPYNVRCIHTELIVHNYFAPRGVVNILISESSYCTAVH